MRVCELVNGVTTPSGPLCMRGVGQIIVEEELAGAAAYDRVMRELITNMTVWIAHLSILGFIIIIIITFKLVQL
jgi:hypothetical protein